MLQIEKRVRALVTDEWGAWQAITDEYPPYTNTDLVEYRENDGSTVLSISDVTRNVTIQGDVDGGKIATGDGYFDDLMESVNLQLKAQFDSGRITGPVYAQVYMGMMQNAMNQAMAFAMNKKQREIETDIAEENLKVAEATAPNKILMSNYKEATEKVNKDIAEATKQTKIDLTTKQLEKLTADISYTTAQQTALEEQVEDNKLIKAIDALGDTYGTFGAGGLTVSSDMWSSYFNMVNTLTGETAPASTTVSKVV